MFVNDHENALDNNFGVALEDTQVAKSTVEHSSKMEPSFQICLCQLCGFHQDSVHQRPRTQMSASERPERWLKDSYS